MLDTPGTAEQDDTAPAEALRAILDAGANGLGFLPDTGYWLVSDTPSTVEYIARLPAGIGHPFGMVTLELRGDEWTQGASGNCLPTVLRDTTVPARWSLAPGQPALSQGTTSFQALVTDFICGTGPEARTLPPYVAADDDAVYVTFEALFPPRGWMDCEHAPPTAYAVNLSEPLGDRDLLDSGVLPFADPTKPD